MNFNMTIRAKEGKSLRMLLDFFQTDSFAEFISISPIDMMEMQGCFATVISAFGTFASELDAKFFSKGSFSFAPALFTAFSATFCRSFPIILQQFFAAIYTIPRPSNINAYAMMMIFGANNLAAFFTTHRFPAFQAERSFSICSVWNAISAFLTKERRIWSHVIDYTEI